MPAEFTAALLASPLVIALTEAVKKMGWPARFAPLAALGCGQVVAWLAAWAEWYDLRVGEPAVVILAGIASGLLAAGLFSGVRAVTTGK